MIFKFQLNKNYKLLIDVLKLKTFTWLLKIAWNDNVCSNINNMSQLKSSSASNTTSHQRPLKAEADFIKDQMAYNDIGYNIQEEPGNWACI